MRIPNILIVSSQILEAVGPYKVGAFHSDAVIETNEEDQTFRYLKHRYKIINYRAYFPMSELTSHIEEIMSDSRK